MIKVVAFDCDDTLWHDSHLFDEGKDYFKSIIMKYSSQTGVREALAQSHINHLDTYGYGIKSFTLTMVELAIKITDSKISAQDIQKIIDMGKNMLHTPIVLCDGVEKTLQKLSKMKEYQIFAITKGDLFAQEIKMERSGLKSFFDVIEIVSEKTSQTYQDIFALHNVKPSEVLMIGNSLKSDILPVLKIGGHGAHIPAHKTWRHEIVEEAKIADTQFLIFDHISEVFDVLERAKTIKDNNFEALYAVD